MEKVPNTVALNEVCELEDAKQRFQTTWMQKIQRHKLSFYRKIANKGRFTSLDSIQSSGRNEYLLQQ